MALIDATPDIVDVSAYGGDTLTISILAPDEITTGMVWTAQVRADREPGTPVAAVFTIVPPEPDLPAYLTLSATETARLAGTGAIIRKYGRSSLVFAGVWDVQLSDPANPDPVITLCQGDLTLDADVTRIGV